MGSKPNRSRKNLSNILALRPDDEEAPTSKVKGKFKTEPQLSAKYGRIIVDTSALVDLMQPLPEACLTKEAKLKGIQARLADILVFLASHGYEVIVPEMVAHECGQFMRDGTSINDYFPHSVRLSEVLFSANAVAFMRTIPGMRQNGINMRIEPPLANDHSEMAGYLRTLWRIHKREDVITEKCNMLKAHAANWKRDHSWGTQAALSLATAHDAHSVPTFVLCNRSHLAEMLPKAPEGPLCQVGTFGLYAALMQHGMLGQVGIDANAIGLIADYLKPLHKNDFGDNQTAHTDRMLTTGGDPSKIVTQKPFLESLSKLQALEKDNPPNAVQEPENAVVVPAITESRIDKFNKKYAARRPGH